MFTEVLGRTNRRFPPVWLRLVPPDQPSDDWLSLMCDAALASGCPLDISSQPALWGGGLRGCSAVLIATSTGEIARATSADHAADLLHAHLIQVLSAVGRERLDVLALPIGGPLLRHQIEGALMGIEAARQEGLVELVAIRPFDLRAVETLWRDHDAFDLLIAPQSAVEALLPLAQARRVGVVVELPASDPIPTQLEAGRTVLATVNCREAMLALRGEVPA